MKQIILFPSFGYSLISMTIIFLLVIYWEGQKIFLKMTQMESRGAGTEEARGRAKQCGDRSLAPGPAVPLFCQ